MTLTKYKLGDLIEPIDERNTTGKLTADDVVGLSTQKEIIKTKADLTDVNLTNYKLFKSYSFAYVPDTSRRGDKMSLAYNTEQKSYIVSSISIVFYVKRKDILLSDYLFMYFNRPEFDRYSRFNSWGSARETFSWDDMCDIEISLPAVSVQQKYVDIYNALFANQKSYERGLSDLKLTCDAYIENLRKTTPCEKIGQYITESDRRNDVNLPVDMVRGLSTNKEMIATIADMDGVNLINYKIVEPQQFAYVADTSRRGNRVSMGFNDTDKTFLVSSISVVFSADTNKLLPKYLMLFFMRSEFDRYARYNSWGSAREMFTFNDMCEVEIPIPDMKIQKAIADIYTAYTTRKQINEKLKAQIKDICPVLIKGSLEEALYAEEN